MWDFHFKLNHVQRLLESRFLRRTHTTNFQAPERLPSSYHPRSPRYCQCIIVIPGVICVFLGLVFPEPKKLLGAKIRFAQGKELVQKLKQRYKDVGRPKMCAT